MDVSTFDAATHYPQGWLVSGLPLQELESGLYGLYTAGTEGAENVLAGFLFTSVKAPAAASTRVGGAMLEHGRVKVANLPVPVPEAGQATAAGRIIFA